MREFVGLVGLGGSRRREADRTTAIGPPAATGWLRCGKQHRLAGQALPHRGCGGGVGSSSRAMCARMLQPNEHTTRFESQEGIHLGSTNRKAGTAAQPLPLDSGSVEGSPGRLGVHAAVAQGRTRSASARSSAPASTQARGKSPTHGGKCENPEAPGGSGKTEQPRCFCRPSPRCLYHTPNHPQATRKLDHGLQALHRPRPRRLGRCRRPALLRGRRRRECRLPNTPPNP